MKVHRVSLNKQANKQHSSQVSASVSASGFLSWVPALMSLSGDLKSESQISPFLPQEVSVLSEQWKAN